jgi:membrane-bound lytic murein transglycosylase D
MLLLTAGRSPARAENSNPNFHFPRPATLEPQIKFWVDVFTTYSIRDFVLVDRDDAYKIYQVYHLSGEGTPTRSDIDWVNTYLKKKYSNILLDLANGHQPVGTDERHVAEMFSGRSPYAMKIAADNLRVQEGLRERFREGLLRSKYYRPTMEKIFHAAGLPVELVTLAQVESGFQRGVRSSAGAVGIWQFTRATGAHYMKVSRYRDDRLNPTRETEAAAKLLSYNYEVLGDWPLAITAYNYGTGGTARAAEESGNDYCKMLQTYNGPHFGFAVKNYYAEFLAALQVHEFEDKYFPGIQYEPAIAPPPLSAQPRVVRVAAAGGRHSSRHHRHAMHHKKHGVQQT